MFESYLQFLDILRIVGVSPEHDAAELQHHVGFSDLISNTDDGSRNFGYRRDAGGWRVTLAYDLNTMPIDVKPRHYALTLDELDEGSSIDTAMAKAARVDLTPAKARAIATDIGVAVLEQRAVVADNGLTGAQIERMTGAFAHEDLAEAVAQRAGVK